MQDRMRFAALLSVFLLIGAGLLGCDQGGGPGTMTKEEARTRITESAGILQQTAADFSGSPFGEVSGAMTNSKDGGPGLSSWGKELISGLGAVLDTTGGGFNYAASTGVYAWDDNSQEWTQERPADSLILQFPATPEATSNNAKFTLSEYETQPVSIGGSTAEVPTQVKSSLSKDGTEVSSFDLRDVSFSPLLGIPQSFTVNVENSLAGTPDSFTYYSNLETESSSAYRYQDELKKGDQAVVATDATITLGGNGDDEGAFGSVDGETFVGQGLSVQYMVDSSSLIAAFEDSSSGDVSAEDVNDSVDIEVLDDGNPVATLRYDGETEQVMVVYPDGETEPLADLLRDLDLQ